MLMACGTLKRACTIYEELLFFTAHIFLQCSAVVCLYFLLSELQREIGAFSGMVSGISLSLTFLPELGRTQGNILSRASLLGWAD